MRSPCMYVWCFRTRTVEHTPSSLIFYPAHAVLVLTYCRSVLESVLLLLRVHAGVQYYYSAHIIIRFLGQQHFLFGCTSST